MLKNLNNTYKIIYIYLFSHYFIQFFFHIIFYDEFSIKYNGYDYSSVYVFFPILFFLIIFFTAFRVMPTIKINKIVNISNKLIYFIVTIDLLIYLIVSVYFALNYGIDFRHKNRYSNAGFLVQLVPFLRVFNMFIVFIYVTKIIRGFQLNYYDRVIIFFIGFNFLLTTTSSLQVLVFLPILVLLFLKTRTIKNILISQDLRKINYWKLIFLFMIISFIAIFIGIANKWGFERALDLFTSYDKIYFLVQLVATRVSTSYFSLLIMAHDHIFDFTLQFEQYSMHIETFLHRLSIFLPIFDFKLDEVRTINHENFLLLFQNNEKEITGATPGLIASIFYLPIFPFNFILMAMYLVLIFRVLDIYLGHKKLSFIGILIIYYLLYSFFSVPPGLLKIIDPMALYFILFIIGIFFIKPQNSITNNINLSR